MLPERTRLLFVVAQQRSGTTALRQTLASGSHCIDFGEIFHDRRADDPTNWWNFMESRTSEDPSLVVFDQRNQRSLWKEYLGLLKKEREGRFGTVDVKYNSWHHLDRVWHLPRDRPVLLSEVRAAKFPVLHLIRRNVFAQACSALLSQRADVFHVGAGEAAPDLGEPLSPNPRKLISMMRSSLRHTDLFRSWFSRYEAYAELSYEELFDGQRLSKRAYAVLEAIADQDFDERKEVPLRKMTANLRSRLADPDALRRRFKGTEFEWMVEEALAGDD